MSFLYSGSSFIPQPIQTALDLKADTTFVEDTSVNTPAYSFWVADGRNDISSVLPLIVNQGSVVYFSQGSFGGDDIVVSNKNNLAFIGPKSSPPIVELVRAITIDATTQRLRISNFLFGGVATLNGSSCRYSYCDFKENVNIGAGATTYITFENCEFRAGKTITLSNTFASACYFINCNFDSATIVLNQSSAVQAIFNNCAGFSAYPAANKSTMLGLNILASGVSQNSVYQNSISKTLLSGAAGTAGQVLTSGGAGGVDSWTSVSGGGGGSAPVTSYIYQEASQASFGGQWNTKTLDRGVNLAANGITLWNNFLTFSTAGKYLFQFSSVVVNAGKHAAAIFDSIGNTILVSGIAGVTGIDPVNLISGISTGCGVVDVTTSMNIYLYHYVDFGFDSFGTGRPISQFYQPSYVETFGTIMVTRIS